MGQETGKVARGGGGSDLSPSPVSYWKGFIPLTLPSANVFLRSHWTERKRLSKIMYLELYDAFKDNFPTRATGKRRVRVEVVSHRQRDHANLWTPVDKLIHDNLTKLQWIVDDSPKYITPEVLGSVGLPGTIVEIWGETC
jgi:hypothetical protein